MRNFMLTSMLVAVSMIGLPANAQQRRPDDPRRAEADALILEGNQLHDRKLEKEALEKFERAYEIYPSPNALFNVARGEHLLGERLKALRHYREALRSPLLRPHGVTLGKKFVAELEVEFARIDLKGPLGLVVVSLGNESVTLPLPEPLDVEPGKITAIGIMNGHKYEASGMAIAGKVLTLDLKAPDVVEEKKNFWTDQHIVGAALGGAAVVAAGVGVGFLIARNEHASDTHSIAADNPNACRVPTSEACVRLNNARNSGNRAAWGEGISFVAAGALAVGAAVLLVPWQTKKEGSHVSARVIPTGQGFLIDGAF